MPTFMSYNPLGSSIETGEISDGSVTAAKLGTGWKLVTSGSADTSRPHRIQSLTARKAFMLICRVGSTNVNGALLLLNFNNDTGANYSYVQKDGVVDAETTGSNYMQIARTPNSSDRLVAVVFFNGKGNNHYVHGGMAGNDLVNRENFVRGIHAGSADVTEVDITSDTNDYVIHYALYYNKDVEDVT